MSHNFGFHSQPPSILVIGLLSFAFMVFLVDGSFCFCALAEYSHWIITVLMGLQINSETPASRLCVHGNHRLVSDRHSVYRSLLSIELGSSEVGFCHLCAVRTMQLLMIYVVRFELY